jgi:hypothetical protein
VGSSLLDNFSVQSTDELVIHKEIIRDRKEAERRQGKLS